MSGRVRRIRFWFTLVITLALLGGAAAGVYRLSQVQASVTYPVAPARKGDFLVIIRCRGELRASRTVQIYAPIVPGLRIAWLAPSGEAVQQGETVIRFDSSASEQQLQTKEAALRQAQATLDQAVAQAGITAEQDRRDLAEAQYNVERAQLEVSKGEILSRIQGEENKIDLGIAEEKLKVQQATVEWHDASSRSKLASLTRQRDQNQADVNITKARIAQMVIKAPISGYLVFMANFSQGWVNAKPFKVGDTVFAGMGLAEIPDLTTLQLEGKIEETDRGRISAGQDARVRVDSLPELTMPAKVGSISLLAEQSFEFPPTRSFRAYAPIVHPDARLRSGMNGGMDIIINRIPNALSIPSKAVFTRAGKPVVYLASHGSYRPAEVKVLARNPDEVAISGVPAGSMVALVDVEKAEKKK